MDQIDTVAPAGPSRAERLDRALDRLLGGDAQLVEPELRPLVRTGSTLAAALQPIPASDRFASQLWVRLQRTGAFSRLSSALIGSAGARRPASWVLITGAVSSAALGVGVTAFAVWRGTRRPAGHGLRVGHR